MKKSEVVLNRIYAVKVSGRVVPVKLMREVETILRRTATWPYARKSSGGGWIGLNLKTGLETRIQTAAKLRWECVQCAACKVWMKLSGNVPLCTKCATAPKKPLSAEARAVMAVYDEVAREALGEALP